MKFTVVLALVGLGFLVATETEALPQFGVSLDAHNSVGFSLSRHLTSNDPIGSLPEIDTSFIDEDTAAHGKAYAGGNASPGFVGVAASSTSVPGVGGASAIAIASFTLDDVIFTGPEPTVRTRELNVNINGALSATDDLTDHGQIFSGVTVDATLSFLVPGHASLNFYGCIGAPAVPGTNGGDCAAGFPFSLGWSFIDHVLFNTPFFTVPTGVPIRVTWELDAFVGGDADAFLLDTLSFPSSGPVFDLPAGFTVNSVEGFVQDNQWLGAPAGPVPEPGSVSLIALAAACMFAGRARRRRSSGGDTNR